MRRRVINRGKNAQLLVRGITGLGTQNLLSLDIGQLPVMCWHRAWQQ
jgi:hypothetical protein